MNLLLALVIAQTGTWGDTFVPEATASHFPAHCEELLVGPAGGWHGEARVAALALFQAMTQAPRCSLRMVEDFTDWSLVLSERHEHPASNFVVTVAVYDATPDVAEVAIYDERGAKIAEFGARKGSPIAVATESVVLPSSEARPSPFELAVVPFSPQLTAAPINTHLGTTASFHYRTPLNLLWAWAEVFANYQPDPTADAFRAHSLFGADSWMRVNTAAALGVETVPLPWSISPYVYAGGGVAFTSQYFGGSVTYLDAGVRPMFEAGLGFRWQSQLGFVARLGVRMMFLPAGSSTAFGCDAAAIAEMESLRAMHMPASFATAKVIPHCDTGHFDAKPDDLTLADAYVNAPPNLLSLVMLDLSVGYAF